MIVTDYVNVMTRVADSKEGHIYYTCIAIQRSEGLVIPTIITKTKEVI